MVVVVFQSLSRVLLFVIPWNKIDGNNLIIENTGDAGLIPGSGRSPGEGNGNPLQYSCLENPTDRGAWWATVHEVAKSRTHLSNYTFTLHSSTIHTSQDMETT